MKERLFIVKLLKKFLNLFLVVSCCFISVNVSAAPTQKAVKIVFVGDRSAGKTAFRNTLIGQQFDFDNRGGTERSDVYLQAVPYDNEKSRCKRSRRCTGKPVHQSKGVTRSEPK